MKNISSKAAALVLAAIIAAFGLAGNATAGTVAGWDFDAGGAIAGPYNTPSSTSGTGSATQLGMVNSYTFNNSEGPGSIAFCDVLASAGASTGTGSFGWRVRGPTNAGGGGAGQSNGWNSAAPIGTQGAEFSASTVGYTGITLSFDVNVTTQAERNLAIEYSLDGGSTWNVATPVAGSQGLVVANSSSSSTVTGSYIQTSTAGNGWNNGITASFPVGAAGDANFEVELVNASTGADAVNGAGNPLNNSSGNWRLDNIVVSGTAVPEPTSLSLVGLTGLGLLARRRNKTA